MDSTDILEVEAFLNNLFAKLSIYGIVFENREKNTQTLLDLGITPSQRLEFIKSIVPTDYISGPTDDEFGGTPLWVFGQTIYSHEIYIKIQINTFGKPVICISFHTAEYQLNYAFK